MFESVLKNLDFAHFASGSHKTAFSSLVESGNGVFLDVRSPEEQSVLALELKDRGLELLHIPIDQIPKRIDEVPRDRPIGVFCPTVVRSSIVYAYLLARGYQQVSLLDGGYPALVGEFLPGKLRGHRPGGSSTDVGASSPDRPLPAPLASR
ncbi:MAG: rhodanese-like domain-containing protein [Coriobacteriia bacterium]|nr:rhodanese-like domain-containing protein [Coriobacteriia bacterium]